MSGRGVARMGLVAMGIAVGTAVAFTPAIVQSDDLDGGAYGLLPAANEMASTALGVEDIALTSDSISDVVPNWMVSGSTVYAQQGGCERVRRPNCNRPGRRSTRR